MHKKNIGFLLAGLLVLPGCLNVPTYKSKSLRVLHNNFSYRQMTNNVVLQAGRLTTYDIEYLFGTRAEQLLCSTEIIHCSIHNLSKHDYVFSTHDQNFSSLSAEQTARLIKTSSTCRIATGIFGGIGISAATNGTIIGGAIACMALGLVPSFLGLAAPYAIVFGLPLVAIVGALPFFGKAAKSMIMNRRIKKDLRSKILTDTIIKSGDTYEGLIFVKSSDYSPQFDLTVHEKGNVQNSITFDVDLHTL